MSGPATTNDRLAGLSREQRALLFEQIRKRKESAGAPPAGIPRRPPGLDPVPASFAQERLWFMDRMEPGNAVYNIPMALRIDGEVAPAVLEAVLGEVVRRHEALRTVFREAGGRPVQVIAPPARWSLPVVDLSGLAGDLREAETRRLGLEDAGRPFDLEAGPLLHATLLRLASASSVLLLNMHHIVSDGWSMGVLVREITAFYGAAVSGWSSPGSPGSPLPELPIQYADFAVWQRGWLREEVLERQIAYWRERLAGVPDSLDLPADRLRPAVPTYRGARLRTTFGRGLKEGLSQLARRHEASLYMVLLAGFQALLFRLTGQEDFSVGSPIANRHRPEVEPLIGFFVNSLVLRGDLRGDPSFDELLAQARKSTLEAFAHQDLPFERLVEELQPERHLSITPLFQVVLALQNAPVDRLDLPGLALSAVELKATTVECDLELHVWESEDSLLAVLAYSTELFDAPTVLRIAGHLEALLQGALADPGRSLSELPLLSEPERAQLLQEWNDTRGDWSDVPLHRLIEARAAAQPDALAVLSAAGERLTYGELDARAGRLARRLRDDFGVGVGPEARVVIAARRSPELIVGMLAVLKAGGAYVPVDPSYPAERVSLILEDSGAVARLGDLGGDDLADSPGPAFASEDADPASASYVIYTSGSTGRPKGVVVSHRSISRYVRSAAEKYRLTPDDRMLQFSSLGFDTSVDEIWCPLAAGATLVLRSEEAAGSVRGFLDEVGRLGITVLSLPTAFWHELAAALGEGGRSLPALPARVRLAVIGGEEAQPHRVASWFHGPGQKVELLNAYGPTEATISATFSDLRGWTEGTPVPIGRPMEGARVYGVGRDFRPVPIGVWGELLIGGVGVARGYLDRPDLTAERFVPDAWSGEPGARVYRSGDLVRFRPDGELQFGGRIDQQIKLRGFRIEPGEIESALLRHPQVREAVVELRQGAGGHRLVAWVVHRAEPSAVSADSHEQVAQWRTLHDESYVRDEAADTTFDIEGWDSSYTGGPIPAVEMREWVERTVERILSLRPRRVVEIGCGTGLLLFRVAPATERYLGTDFSRFALEGIRRLLARGGLPQAELRQAEADDWGEIWRSIAPGEADLVILNSVVQYFPSPDYLARVLEGAVRTVAPGGGSVFIGDVRSLPLLEAFATSVERFQAPDLPAEELRRRVFRRVMDEEELVVAPLFFFALAKRLPAVRRVSVLLKRGRWHNELTRFRYDVVLHTGETETVPLPLVDGGGFFLGDIERLLGPRVMAIGGLVDARVTENGVRSEGIDPEDLWELAERRGYDAELSVDPDAPGRFRAVLKRQGNTEIFTVPAPDVPDLPWSAFGVFANDPLRSRLAQRLGPELRRALQAGMPDYMVPSAFVVLDALPLTPNGKVDRAALPEPEAPRSAASTPPRTPAEMALAAVWKEVLGIEEAGLEDNFFELGGHSLLATQLVSRVSTNLGVDLPLRTVFERPTLGALADALEKTLSMDEEAPSSPHGIVPQGLTESPLSFAQERLWFIDRLERGIAAYNVPLALAVHGALSPAALEAALGEILRRHGALRTTFSMHPPGTAVPLQVVSPPRPWSLPRVDLSALPAAIRQEEILRLAVEDARRPFDLERGPLLRSLLLVSDAAEHTLLLAMHHIVSDGWSMGVLVSEIVPLYQTALAGGRSPLPELPVQYTDFAVWQRRWLQGEVLEEQIGYWRERLRGAPAVLELPMDRPRPAAQSYRGAKLHFALGSGRAHLLGDLIRDFALRHEATPFMVLLAAFQALLRRYTGQDDVVVGSAIANRNHAGTAPLIGFFVNTLVLRTRMPGDPAFARLLADVRETALGAYAHQDLPFERLVEELQPERSLGKNPLFQVMFVLQNAPLGDVEIPEIRLSPIETGLSFARFDLTLSFEDEGGRMLGEVEYSTDLFERPTMERLAGHYQILLAAALEAPGRYLSELPLLSEPECAQLLREWNDTRRGDLDDIPLHRLVEARALAQPDALAVLSAAGESLTYGELDARAGRLARRLRDDFRVGVGPESRVAITASRSPGLIVGMLAVLKAGGAYVPIDPGYPAERVSQILEDSGALMLLGDARNGDLEDRPGPVLASEPSDPANTAYVIYTSGSTGRPKGVVVPHRAVSRHIRNAVAAYGLNPGDRAFQFASLGFDFSVEEIWGALAAGATLVLRSGEAAGSLSGFLGEVDRLGVTVMSLPTAFWHELAAALGEDLRALPPALRLVVIGGEEVRSHALASWRRRAGGVRLLSIYGPTEVTVCSHRSSLERWGEGEPPPLGQPIEGARSFAVDAGLDLVPAGVWGELLIGGEGVARGYLDRPDLTAERFVPDAWSGEPGARVYRSGDLVRFRPDGELQFGGRIDHQVKIRGFRIEPGEIENALLRHPRVREAVVEARKGAGGGRQLVAWVVPRPEPAAAAADRHEHVAQWRMLYDDTYARGEAANAADAADATFDVEGWNSTYTGQPIPAAEMREWVERTVERILSLRPRRPWRILEIGCGTGLLLFRVAPAAERYLGTDFSRVALEGIRRLLAGDGLPQAELRQAEAANWGEIWSGMTPGEADLVILNSVSQYFPDPGYLARVLEGAVQTVAPAGGSIFIGDVRSLSLLEVFATSVERFQAPDLPAEELRRRVRRRMMDEEELVVDPAFFFALARRLPAVRRVSVLLKRGRWHNELTRFRYDVILHTGETGTVPLPLVDGGGFSLEDVERLLGPQAVAIGGLADARLAEDTEDTENGVRSEGIDPEDLWELAERRGYDAELSVDPDAPGRFRALLKRQGSAEVFTLPAPAVPDLPWSAFSNDPLRNRLAQRLGPELRRALQDELPDYMVPSAFVVLDALPLTPNGKVDRAALPDPEPLRSAAATPPRTPAEQALAALWKDVLGIEEVGLEDNFFDLGGHSLLATQLVSRVRSTLGIDFPLRSLFEHQTLRELAAVLPPLARETAATVPRRPPDLDPIPASFAQERLWLLDRLQPGNPAYNIPNALRVLGEVSPALLEVVLGEVVRRHEALRTAFRETDGRPVQVIHPPAPPGRWTLPLVDLAGLPEEMRAAEARRLAVEEAVRPFDLARGPLLRASLLRLEEAEHGLLLAMHHIVSDGWSMGVLVREMTALYEAALAGKPSPLPDLPIQYADFAVWQRGWLQRGELERQLSYWRQQLRDLPASLDLPADRPRPAAMTHRGDQVLSVLDPDVTRELARFARRHDATLFMVVLAVFQALLRRLTGQQDVPVGTPIANRNRTEIEPLIGFFVNTLVMRSDLRGEPSFNELLARVQKSTLEAYAHQDVPFEQLVEELRPERHLSLTPLFQVLCAVQNAPVGAVDLPGLTLAPFEIEAAVAQFDLELNAWETEGFLALFFTYSAELFDPATVRRLAGSMETLLRGVLADPERRLPDLPLLSAVELHQILLEWNDTRWTAEPTSVLERFAAQAARTPEAPALEAAGELLTYGELDRRSNRLAHRLRRLGAGPGTVVGLLLERSAEMVAGLLAVWKAGGAYVPLDPGLPKARLEHMLEDSQAALVLDRSMAMDLAAESDLPLAGPSCPEDLAYRIYTSGTTGLPKAVDVEHRQLASTLAAVQEAFGFRPEDRMPGIASSSFDIFLFELLGPLLAGGLSVLLPLRPSLDLERLLAELEAATLLHAVPAVMRQVVDLARQRGASAPRLRGVFTGGDTVPADLLADLRATFPRARTWVLYGPTEAAIVCSSWPVPAEGPVRSLLGRPFAGVEIRVCDRAGLPVPIGVPGEIWIGGAGVARGYCRREELTAEKFVELDGRRFYRSGDLARRLPDGTLEFLGRGDQQVKVRGFRIELGEVEAALLRQPGVGEAVVLAPEAPGGGGRRLVAYVVPEELETTGDEPADRLTPQLRRALQAELPDYMVPSRFVVLDSLPLTAHGKVDRSALAELDPVRSGPASTPPRTPLEQSLAAIWRELLGVDGVGLDDNFFELGGHSLLATRLVSRVRDVLGADLPLRTLFERPTLGGLAEAVEEQQGAIPAPLRERVARLSPEQRAQALEQFRKRRAGAEAPSKRIPRRAPDSGPVPASLAQERLWFMDRLAPGSSVFNMPSPLRLRGPLEPEVLERSFQEVFRRHESLRTRFEERDGAPVQGVAPPGPWFLPRVDLGALPPGAGRREAERLATEEGGWPFDLSRGPLLRALLLRLAEEDHALLMTCHHIVSDGWSMGVLVEELTACYQAFATGRPSPLPELPIQYADYAAWQRAWLAGGGLEEQIGYWRERLAGAPAHLDLPLDRPRPAVQTYRGDSVTLALPRDLNGRLQALSVAESASLFMTLLAGLKVVLHRWSGQDDVVVGTPVAGRERPETEGLIGYFLNLLALRTGLSGNPRFRELLRRVRESALGAYSHQTVPFERLLLELEVERDLSRSPVFQVLFNMLNLPAAGGTLPGGLLVEPFGAFAVEAKYEFTLYAQEGAGEVFLNLVYNPDLFEKSRMEELLRQLRTVLEQIALDPDRPLESLSLVTPEAAVRLPDLSRSLAREWHGAVHEWFLEWARQYPDRIAAVDSSSAWTWRDLDAASGNLAARLPGSAGIPAGLTNSVVVAVWAHRAAPLAAALLGVLRAGAAFVILDPAYPPARLAAVVDRAHPHAWVEIPGAPPVPLEVAAALAGTPRLLRLGVEGPGAPADPGAPCVPVHPDAPAWIAFTSGSTGEPKGIVGSHRPLSHFLDWHASTFGLGEEDRFSLLSGLAHDPLLRDVFTPLWVGGSLRVPDPERMAEPGWLAGWLRREEVTVAHLTPAMGRLLEDGCAVPSLRLVCSGGEALAGEDVARLRCLAPGAVLVNFYGATETPQAMGWKVVEGTPARVPLGRGIEGVDLLVLGSSDELAGVGELGEICIRTPYLALGYLDDPASTAERFAPAPGGRLYRTGDLGRYLPGEPGGDVTYAGRADRQLKIRGFRVEPGEIEAAIGRMDGVRDSVVIADEDSYLVAYVVPEAGASGLAGRLRPFLASQLPGYMVPAAFVELPALPLTPNGKVDRRALPAPPRAPVAGEGARTPVEETLAGIWAALLRRPRIGLHESFFDLGGHSLLATQMVARVRAVLGVELPLRALFDHPTLAGLAARIEAVWRARATGLPEPPPLRPVPREHPLPLSFAQERLWFLAQLAPESTAYGMPAAVRLTGDLDREALAATLSEIRRRHETLRTTFELISELAGGEPVQAVHSPEPLPLPLADLSALPAELREGEAYRLAEELARTPYDLARGPLVRARLLRLAADEHALLWNTHHIVSDAWSVGVLVRELGALYTAFVQGRPSPLPEPPLQYGDYAAWQRDWLRGPALEEQIGYWRKRLAGASPLDLPTDRPRPAVPSTRGASRAWTLPAETLEALRRLALAEGATLFMALHAGFSALLHLYTGRTDVVVGSPVANRSRAELEGLIGFFINTLVLRADLAGDPGFPELIARSREMALGAWAHQDLPFEKLADELGLPRDPFRQPLLRVVLQLRNVPVGDGGVELPGLTLAPFDLEVETAKFDLVVNFAEGADALHGEIRYDTDLFDPSTIERLAGHLGNLLDGWIEEPGQSLSSLSLLAEGERHQLLVEWNPEMATEDRRCLHRLFEEQVDRTPDAIAVSSSLTYRELDEWANRLARRLRARGAGPGRRVALKLDRSAGLVAAILAVLKTGAAYVPLDPAYPAERLAFVLEDSGATLLVEEGDLSGEGESAERLDLPADSDLPAYVIYTSGSTGRPKGVVVTHANVDRLFTATAPWFGFGPDDVWTLFHSYAFDFSVWELWGALLHGGRLVVVPYWESRDPEAFYRLLRDERVTVLNQTPSAFRQLLWAEEAVLGDAPPDLALRWVIFGGEALEPASLAPWFARHGDARPRLVNMYGITETTVHVTFRPIQADDLGRGSVLGQPIPDLAVHVLGSALRPQPIGVPGEIHVGGAGLAQGYLGRPDLTAERFVPDPFCCDPGARLYRSGDLARRLPDGDLEYLGRIDHQVKIRGFRIELGEIEAALAVQPGVREAVVLARAGDKGERRLVAYVAGEATEPAVLREALALRLPDHMLPSAFVFLDALPLTENGKVDRRALPDPEASVRQRYEPPRTDLERFLASLFHDVLGLGEREAGLHDDFFELGGTSITGAIFIHRLQEALSEIVHVVTIFDHPTVASLAGYIREQHGGAARRLWGEGLEETEEASIVGPAEVEEMDRLIVSERPEPISGPEEPLNPPAVFVLAPPRSGTTLLRVMLGAHPALFAPPELELLSFQTLAERRAAFQGRDSFWLEGLVRAVMEARGVEAAEAERIVEERERQGWTTQRFYRELQEQLGDRVLVDKTPSYALDPEVLRRAEEGFAGARYLHLVRHPQATNRSFEEAKLDQIFFRRLHPFSRRQLAELVWTVSHRNILGFLAGIPRERWLTVRFEELVREPDRVLTGICGFLGLPYQPEMAEPYREGVARMVGGPHAVSRMLGDVKFLGHGRVDPAAAERWRAAGEQPLGEPAREVAKELSYLEVKARGVLVPLQPGSPDRRPLFCVHPVGGEVVAYRELARRLGSDQPVYGLQSPDPAIHDLWAMATHYLEALREVQPEGPYRLAGWSMGGVVAYEMARQLAERGEGIEVLALIDTASPAYWASHWASHWAGEPEPDAVEMVALFASDLARLHGAGIPDVDLSGLDEDGALARVLDLGREAGLLPPSIELAELRRLFDRFRANRRALSSYSPLPYDGNVTLFRAAERVAQDPALGWGTLVNGNLEVLTLPGDHYALLREEAEILAGRLRTLLRISR